MMNLDKQNLTATPAINAKSEPAGASDGKRQAANVLLLILTCLTSVAFERHHYYWLPLLAIPLIFYGLKRPFDLLTLALVLAPLDIGFKNDRANNLPVIFSISDVLLLMALPGAALRLRRRPDVWSLGGMTLPMLGYLLAGLLSFAVNLPQMGSGGLGFFGGWIRNAQSVLGLPLLYASMEWRWPQIRSALRGHLLCVLLIAVWGLINFWHGMRAGLYILSIHKNVLGLAMAMGALVALISCLPPARRERFANRSSFLELHRPLLAGAFAIYLLTLVCSLSRGSLISLLGGFLFVCVLWRRPALFVALLLLTMATVYGVREVLPPAGKHYTTDFSEQSSSVGDRLGMIRESARRFRAQPLLGDGFRIRREILPHNVEAMVLAENGLIGFGFLVWGVVAQFRLLRRGYRALEENERLQSFVAIVAVCAVATLIHGQVEPYWRRGPLLLVWAGSGIVWSLVLQKRREALQRETEAAMLLVAPPEPLKFPATL